MKNRLNWKYAIGALCFLSMMYSCTSNFDEYNTNQYEATDEMLAGLIKIGAFFPTMQADVVPTSDVDANEYQRAQNLAGDIHSGYMAAIGTWNYGNNASQYNLAYDRWNDVAFSVAFRKVMPAWKEVKDKSGEEYPEVFAVAEIIKIEAMHRITDIYGPLPYMKFGHGEITTPYDSQEVIYKSFFEDLDKAITTLKNYVANYPSSKPLKKYDMIYGGDFAKWITFANSLKLRLAMRLAYVEPKLAQQYAEEAVKAGVMQTNADNAFLKSNLGISVFNPLKICWDSYSDIRMGALMESFLVGYNDPRLPMYFQESELGGYHGARLGNNIYNKAAYEKLSSPNVMENTPVQWMVAAEMYFLRAEGAIRGWAMNGDAKKLYEDGIRTSFEQWKASLGSYLTNSTAKPAAFVAKAGSGSVSASNSLLPTITVPWVENDDFEVKLERILTQKWLAIYPDGQEAWTEFRRTGYPKVFPVLTNRNSSVIDTELQVRRLPFPQSEYDTNEEEVSKAIQLLGGNDNGGTKLWWDKKVRK